MNPDDSFDLKRFETAQAQTFEAALSELEQGRKRSHWMWFVFPQLRGLDRSPTAEFYGLSSLAEARAYLAHPVLGPRLLHCTAAVLNHGERSLAAIFGSPDDLKFVSSMTLFAAAAGDRSSVFEAALERLAGGSKDPRTVAMLEHSGTGGAGGSSFSPP